MNDQRALIVGDGVENCPPLEKLLIQRGLIPERACNTMEILAKAEERPYSFYFIDVNLPESTGFEVAEQIKKMQPDAVIIFTYRPSGNNLEAAKVGSVTQVRKPYDLDRFLLFVRESLEKKQYLAEIETKKRQLRESEQKYTRLVKNIPAVVYRIRPDFNLSFISDYCGKILGLSPEEIMGENQLWDQYIHPEDRKHLTDRLTDCFKRGKVFTYEHRIISADGAIRHVMNRGLPIRGEDNTIKEVEGILIDRTMAKLIEQRLIHTEKMRTLGEISADIAHEISNPLVCIGGMVSLLLRKLPKNYSNFNKLRIIADEVTRLENLLHRILDYVKPRRTPRSVSDVNQLVRDVVCLFECQMKKYNIITEVILDRGGCVTCIDPDSMKQVLSNLVLNSMRAMTEGGNLKVETIKGPKSIRIIIQDNGTGIPEEISQTILNPFVSNHPHGTGLGLSISKQIVQSFGGSLSFETERDKGTRFIVSIPPKPPKLDYPTGQMGPHIFWS
ncbi:MAG: ATP-binding protein [Thermodesulfobacteriota bacterium]